MRVVQGLCAEGIVDFIETDVVEVKLEDGCDDNVDRDVGDFVLGFVVGLGLWLSCRHYPNVSVWLNGFFKNLKVSSLLILVVPYDVTDVLAPVACLVVGRFVASSLLSSA